MASLSMPLYYLQYAKFTWLIAIWKRNHDFVVGGAIKFDRRRYSRASKSFLNGNR